MCMRRVVLMALRREGGAAPLLVPLALRLAGPACTSSEPSCCLSWDELR